MVSNQSRAFVVYEVLDRVCVIFSLKLPVVDVLLDLLDRIIKRALAIKFVVERRWWQEDCLFADTDTTIVGHIEERSKVWRSVNISAACWVAIIHHRCFKVLTFESVNLHAICFWLRPSSAVYYRRVGKCRCNILLTVEDNLSPLALLDPGPEVSLCCDSKGFTYPFSELLQALAGLFKARKPGLKMRLCFIVSFPVKSTEEHFQTVGPAKQVNESL